MEKVYIDTNIFLNPILYNIKINQEAKRSLTFLKKVIKKQVLGITSVLTWDEFVWIIKKTLGYQLAIEKGKEFLIFPNLKFKNISFSTINRAQDIFLNYNIRPRDAIHVACALEHDINKIISFDGDFDIVKEIERSEP